MQGLGVGTVLDSVVSAGIIDKVVCEQRHEDPREELKRKSIPHKETS